MKKLIVIVLVISAGLVILGISLSPRGKFNQSPKAYATPAPPVLSVIKRYLRARENSVGVDQSSPTAWLSAVKPIVTAAWYNHLVPSGSSPTSNISFDYIYAHQNGLTVRAEVTNCYWQGLYSQPTSSGGSVFCSLSDKTIKQKTGAVVSASSLQLGWAHTGKQPAPSLLLVNRGGNWLIDGDSTGQGH